MEIRILDAENPRSWVELYGQFLRGSHAWWNEKLGKSAMRIGQDFVVLGCRYRVIGLGDGDFTARRA